MSEYACAWCQRPFISSHWRSRTRDHVMPKSRGGRSTVWACRACNELKGDMSLMAWAAVMTKVPEWWTFAERKGPRGVQLHQAMIECGFDMPPLEDGHEAGAAA